jgi:hypothetical protein
MGIYESLERATQRREQGPLWTDEQFRAARETDLQERTVTVRVALAAVGLALTLALLLTSGRLVEIAQRQPFGSERDRYLAWAEGVDRVANFVALNRPLDALTELRQGLHDQPAATETSKQSAGSAGTDPVLPVEEREPETLAEDRFPDGSAIDADTADEVPVEDGAAGGDLDQRSPATGLEPSEAPRAVSAEAPLRVYMAGDSQTTYLSQAVISESAHRALTVTVDDRISTSLARPDYFDWPTQWAAQMAALDPELVVLFIGANDHQDMVNTEGTRLVEGSEEWRTEWRSRLSNAFDVLAGDQRMIYWVTQPPMRNRSLDAGSRLVNAIAAEIIGQRQDVIAVDIWPLFGGESGFQDRQAGPDGNVIKARVGDGVHLTRGAASWVAERIFTQMDKTWSFDS